MPPNITIMALPPKCPELNPVENAWQFPRDNWLSNRVFKSYDDLVDHCCVAWNKLVNQPWRIMSIGLRQSARRSDQWDAVLGTTSRRISSRFGNTCTFRLVTPVRFPPGRARLPTSPVAIGSAPISKTIGIVGVAGFAASAAGAPPGATITATGRAANSAASDGNLSCWPSAQRNSIATFRPSAYPASPRPWRKALTRLANAAGDPAPRYPITGVAGCCARAASGHAGCRAAEERDELAPF